TLRVRRNVTHDDRRSYREGALAYLKQHAHLSERCGCSVTRKRWGGGTTSDRCSARPAHVVVTAATDDAEFDYHFVCGRHRDKHGIKPAYVLGVVDLSEHDLAPLRKQAEEERVAQARKDAEQRRARFAAALPTFEDRAGVPEGWTYTASPERARWSCERNGLRLEVELKADDWPRGAGEVDVELCVRDVKGVRSVVFDILHGTDARALRDRAIARCLLASDKPEAR
ncbi:MAG TPA: hypothetical protein VHF22_03885, partial [Planctomycetota bacterium]|nr:hypothetical protein [Planctomycetota bacterium]